MNPKIVNIRKRRLGDGMDIIPLPDATHIMSIPQEMLTAIFKLLDTVSKIRVAQVCRGWRDATMLKEVWRDTIVAVDVNVNALTREPYDFLSCRGVRKIALVYPLRVMLGEIPAALPPAMLSALPGLTHLTLSHCRVISDDYMMLICLTFKEMVSLQLGSDVCQCSIKRVSIGYICNGLKKLESLTFMYSNPQVNDDGIRQLANSDLPLRFLALQSCTSLTDDSIRVLSLGKPSLEELELGCCSMCTDASIHYIATMKKLRYLKLGEMRLKNVHWETIAGMASLRSLSLYMFHGDSFDYGVVALTNGRAPIEKLVLNQFQTITDASLKLVAAMPHLRRLSISHSDLPTQQGLEDLMRGNKKLTSLEIISCVGIRTQKALECIAANQPNLRRLHLLSKFPLCIGMNLLAKVGRLLPRLIYLNVDNDNLLSSLQLMRPQI